MKNVFKIPPDFIIDRIFWGLTFYQRKKISKKEEKSSFDQGLSIALVVAYTYFHRRIKSIKSRFCETKVSIMVDVDFSFCFCYVDVLFARNNLLH